MSPEQFIKLCFSQYRSATITFILLIVLSVIFHKYISLILLVWSLFIGVAIATYSLSVDTLLPNLLFIQDKDQTVYEKDEVFTIKKLICTVCGEKNCPRHRPELNLLAFQPWTSTTLPLAVDSALEEFLDIVLQNFIYTWYKDLSCDEEFINELRVSIRFVLAVCLRRLKNIDITKLIIDKLAKAVMQHCVSYMDAISRSKGRNESEHTILEQLTCGLHCAMHSRKSEVEYIRRLVDQLFPYILSPQALNCQSVRALIREVLTGSVILPGLDAVADPDMVNKILLTGLDRQQPVPPTQPPSPSIEVLTAFSRPRASTTSTLQLGMNDVMNRENTRLLYAFMQFLKSEAAINVMQFTLQCEDLNNRLLTPDLSSEEIQELYAMVNELYRSYCAPDALDRIRFHEDIEHELKQIIEGPVENVVQLRRKACLFKAYEHAYSLLEDTFLPLFHQSDHYYKMLCGGRENTTHTRTTTKPVKKKEFGFTQLGSKIIDVFRTNTVEGKFSGPDDDWDVGTSVTELNEGGGEECLSPASSPLHDLSTWRVSIPRVGARPHPNNSKKELFVYIVVIFRVTDTTKSHESSNWSVARQYKEFYVLEQKLKEFHGDDNTTLLPTRKTFGTKNHEFMDSRRETLELYLQKLLTKPQLKGSQLLHTFLTSDTEFTNSFLPDINLGRIIKTVPMILIKERGQHLDSFLQSFVTSTEAPKPKSGRMERRVSDTSTVSMSSEASEKYWSYLYGNNANTRGSSRKPSCDQPIVQLEGVFDSLLYVMNRLYGTPSWLYSILSTGRILFKSTVDSYASWFVTHKLRLVTQEHRVVTLIHLLKDVLFFNSDPPRSETERQERLDETMREVKAFIPRLLYLVLGSTNVHEGTAHIVDMLQYPKLNKNLSYIMLDIIILELFPELQDPHYTHSHGSPSLSH